MLIRNFSDLLFDKTTRLEPKVFKQFFKHPIFDDVAEKKELSTQMFKSTLFWHCRNHINSNRL